MLADLILPPVCQEFASGVHFCKHYNVKRKEKKNKKHNIFELETCERTGFNFIRPPGTPFNSMQYSAMVRYDGKHCLTNICEYLSRVAVLRVCNLNRAIALRFNIDLNKTL